MLYIILLYYLILFASCLLKMGIIKLKIHKHHRSRTKTISEIKFSNRKSPSHFPISYNNDDSHCSSEILSLHILKTDYGEGEVFNPMQVNSAL